MARMAARAAMLAATRVATTANRPSLVARAAIVVARSPRRSRDDADEICDPVVQTEPMVKVTNNLAFLFVLLSI